MGFSLIDLITHQSVSANLRSLSCLSKRIGSAISSSWILALILFIPGAYTMYSVKKYFGFLRAAGADHFDSKYRDLPFENRGIFKWTPNAMYVFAIGIPFSFAVATGSQSMFVVAIYTYISIWLHYFCTEKPDFAVIYNN